MYMPRCNREKDKMFGGKETAASSFLTCNSYNQVGLVLVFVGFVWAFFVVWLGLSSSQPTKYQQANGNILTLDVSIEV